MDTERRVDFAKYKTLWEGVTERMRRQPERPVFGYPYATVRVIKDHYFEAETGGHTFHIDEPQIRGDGDQAPTPMGYFVAGAAG